MGELPFDSWQGYGVFLLSKVSRQDLVPTQPPIQWILRKFPTGVQQPDCEAKQSPPSRAKIKNEWRYTSITIYLHGAHTDNCKREGVRDELRIFHNEELPEILLK